MIPQWASKWVCKFAMNKLLGRILRNEPDLEQLDVQIGSGIIHLKDLALNTAYFNDQLGDTSPVVLKEGLIGSVTAKNMWNILSREQPCEVQIHGLELVLVPRFRPQTVNVDEAITGSGAGSTAAAGNEGDVGGGMGGAEAAYGDIEVGVRLISQIVEKVLLGLCVKVSNLTIILEHPQQQESPKTSHKLQTGELDSKLPCTLLFRAGYVEYGNDSSLSQMKGAEVSSILKNVKIRGVTVGFLPNDVKLVSTAQKVPTKLMFEHAVPVLTGPVGGGVVTSIQLKIPLREGSLDIPKISTEFLIQPFKVFVSVWRVQQLLYLVNSISSSKRIMEEMARGSEKRGERLERLADMLSTRTAGGGEGGVEGSSVFLPATNLISDWMRWGGGDSQKLAGDIAEADLAASVDEFFECLDTGSMLLAADAWKQVEYRVKARFISVSVEVAFRDFMKEVAPNEERLHLHLAGTNLSFAMSEKKTDLSLAVESVELWEAAQQGSEKELNATTQGGTCDSRMMLSSLIEDSLPPYEVALYPKAKEVDTMRSFFKVTGCDGDERKMLLRVNSSRANQSVQVNLKFSTHVKNKSGGAEESWSLDVDARFQPIISWLDFQSVERLIHLMSEINTPDTVQQSSSTGSTAEVAGFTSVHLTASISSIRVMTCGPPIQIVCSSESHRAFFALDLASPSLDIHFSGIKTSTGDSLLFGMEDAAIFLVTTTVRVEEEQSPSRKGFQADQILRIKQHGGIDASVEISWNRLAETGPWIAKQAWDVSVAQRRKGDGGGGIGGAHFEFVAAISADVAEEADLHLKEKLIQSSSTLVQARLPFIGLHLSRSQYLLFLELLAFVTSTMDSAGEQRKRCSGSSSTSQPFPAPDGLQVPQTSIVVQCGLLDAILDLSYASEEMMEGVKYWDILHFDINKLQVLSVLQMGGSQDASYLRVHHEECQVSGSPPDTWLSPLQGDTDEVLLFSCKNSALQRGNGGGGNVLAVGTAGITATYVAWPYRESLADDFLIGNVKGCTIVAYGGRLEWISAVISFFDPSEVLTTSPIKKGMQGSSSAPQEGNSPWRKYFLLDLHDAALGYEPGLEALQAPEASAVACVLAAAAVRVSSGDSVEINREQYDVRLRDAALHVLDLEFKKQAQFSYSTEAIKHAGFIQVAKETSMGVTVRIGGENGRKWEVECGNNEICFDTCHDTTAACERLVAQLQHLFAPPMEQQSVQIKMHKVEVKAANVGEPPDLLDGVLENAFISLKDLQPEPLDLATSGLSSKDVQEFIEDYVSEHTPGGHSEHSDDSPRFVKAPSTNPVRGGAPGGGWYEDSVFNIVENHIPSNKPEAKPSLPKKYPKSIGRMILQNMSVKWRLHEGSDWPFCDDNPDWNMQGAIGDSGRKPNVCLEVFLNRVNMQYDLFPATELYASKLTVTICNFGVLDCSPDAPWKPVMGYHHVPSRPRETSSQAIKIDVDAVRPDPTDALEEYRVSFALLPIRLHLDQRHLDFCTKFFSLSTRQETLLEENLNLSRGSSLSSTPSVSSTLTDSPTEPLLPFFQMFEVLPFNIRVDYLPRRVDLAALRAGNYAELVNIVQWKGIDLELKHVKAAGVHGLSSFSRIFLNEWLQDIFQNQLFKFVQGAGPIRPLYAAGSGAAKLVVTPAQQYWKEHRLFHEMRKGLKRVSSIYKKEKRDAKQTDSTGSTG